MCFSREVCEFEVDKIAATGAGVRKKAPAQANSDSDPAWYFEKHLARTLAGICQPYPEKFCSAVCRMMKQLNSVKALRSLEWRSSIESGMDWIVQYQRWTRVFGLMLVMGAALAAGPPEGVEPEVWCEENPEACQLWCDDHPADEVCDEPDC
jgi:hypothetical protein